MIFTSDNASGAAPEVLAALAAGNPGYTMPYGADDGSARVEAMLREIFEAPEARVFLVATGTAANALALATYTPPWGSILCHRLAHIEEDECNAPEFYAGGAKLTVIEGDDAKIDAAVLERVLGSEVSVHNAQPAALSITQATERGAVYTAEEVAALSGAARARGLSTHMDGTRFANALAATNASPAEMSWRAGVDVLCLGATKCGAMAAEAVILFDPAKAREFELRRKRGGHLFSKMRFVAAQMEAWLADGLWLRLAAHANAMAARLREGMAARGVKIVHPGTGPAANLFFVEFSGEQHAALQTAGMEYYASAADAEGRHSARIVASFATREEDVEAVLAAL